MAPPSRKQIRLHHEPYKDQESVCSLTIVTQERKRTFMDTGLAAECVQLLLNQAEQIGIQLHAYCLMPDHLHLLLSPSDGCTIFDFVGQYKSISTRVAWRHGFEGKLWQARFFDHFLRKDEDIKQTVQYIVGNPVRKGLVSDWRDYPFSGSLVYDLER